MLFLIASHDEFQSKRTLRRTVYGTYLGVRRRLHSCFASRKPIILQLEEDDALRLARNILTQVYQNFELKRKERDATQQAIDLDSKG